MNIRVHIERLILEGLPIASGQGPLLQAAVEAELTRLLAAGGLAPGLLTGGAAPQVAAGAIRLTGDSNPTQLGQQVAQAVYRGIGQ